MPAQSIPGSGQNQTPDIPQERPAEQPEGEDGRSALHWTGVKGWVQILLPAAEYRGYSFAPVAIAAQQLLLFFENEGHTESAAIDIAGQTGRIVQDLTGRFKVMRNGTNRRNFQIKTEMSDFGFRAPSATAAALLVNPFP